MLAVKPWAAVSDYTDLTGEINQAILESFRGRGIVMPFPQHEVRLLGQAP
jgi:small conductance mechanosensitive channel